MAANNSSQSAGELEFKRPFWSGRKTRLIFCALLLPMTVAVFREDQVMTASWVWLALAWYVLAHWLRRDFRDLQEGGGRFLVDDDHIRSFRFGREASIAWPEITKLSYGVAHLRLVSRTTKVSIPTNLPGYNRIHKFVYAHAPAAALETAQRLPIRVRYDVKFSVISSLLALWFLLLLGHGVLAPSGYRFSEGLLVIVPVLGLFVWLVGRGFYEALTVFEFHEDRITVRTPFKTREYPTAGLLDIQLESESEQDTTTVLKLILSGGEYLTVRDGNPSVGELYQILRQHYLPLRRESLPKDDQLGLGL